MDKVSIFHKAELSLIHDILYRVLSTTISNFKAQGQV